MTKLKIGDRVAFSAAFLRDTQCGYDRSKLRGTLVTLNPGWWLCDVLWDGETEFRAVHIGNLCRLNSVAFAEAPYAGKTYERL